MEQKQNLHAFYFSGTGNTAYAVRRFCRGLQPAYRCRTSDITTGQDFAAAMQHADTIIIAYPIYGGLMPQLMRGFIYRHMQHFAGKQIIILVTQYFFSGDGAALLVRMLQGKVLFRLLGTVHVNMPNNISDSNLFKVKNGEQLTQKLQQADRKIDKAVKSILTGKQVKQGRRFYSRALGLSQRYFFRKSEPRLSNQLEIDHSNCIHCGICVNCCPAKNLTKQDGKIEAHGQCTLCYRCVNRCPKKAIRLCSKKRFPTVQYRGIPPDTQ